jgi:glycosyltransferase involved in cell wall biosynthesis
MTPVRLLVPVDRLDGRPTTFSTYLTGLLGALARRRERRPPLLDGLPQVTVPPLLEGNRMNSLLYPLWARHFGATVIHYPNRFFPYSWWGLPARKVVTVHDTAFLSVPDELVPSLRRRTVWRIGRALRRMDAVVTVSDWSKSEILRHFDVPPERIHVIGHGLDPAFRPGEPTVDLAAKYGVRPPYLLNVSSIKKKKNVDGLVRVFARLRKEGYPHTLVLVGKPDSGSDDVRREIDRHGLGGEVTVTGFVEAADHPDFYRQANLLVYPSFYEGYGMPVIEAMASGCPVVTSDVASLPEAAGGAAVLVDPRDDEAILAGVRSVLDNPARRGELVSLGLRRVSGLTWDRIAAQHLRLYRSLLRVGDADGR